MVVWGGVLWQGFAVAMIWGLLGSTLLTLVLQPAAYALLGDLWSPGVPRPRGPDRASEA